VDAAGRRYATIDDGLITVVATNVEGRIELSAPSKSSNPTFDPDTFWRVHRSFLVNIHRIKEVIPWFQIQLPARMDDKKQTEVPVSRVQTKRFARAV